MPLRWLHLTDLHLGMPGASPLWPSVQADFYSDLERLHAAAGGIDLLLFTGDLAFGGKAEELAQVDTWLEALVGRLRALGSDPLLLAVPGNHDLIRPDASKLAVRALLNWTHDQDLRVQFWDDRGREPRALVETFFADYVRWMEGWRARHPVPAWATLGGPGLLSGDFSATIERDGLSLGLVGLNSAFLHLNGKIGRGQIASIRTSSTPSRAGIPTAGRGATTSASS